MLTWQGQKKKKVVPVCSNAVLWQANKKRVPGHVYTCGVLRFFLFLFLFSLGRFAFGKGVPWCCPTHQDNRCIRGNIRYIHNKKSCYFKL